MNNHSHQPSAVSFLISAMGIALGAVMALLVLSGAPPHTTAQSGYPAPATTPAYPPPAESTATRPAATATPATPATLTVPVPGTTIPTMPTLSPTIRPTLTVAPSPTRVPPTSAQLAQVAEVTPTPPGILSCAPGQTIMIGGVASPHAPLLLYFGTRIVSGGSARASGDFAMPLIMGMERAGEYQVTVRVRGTGQVVRSVTCLVPPTTPTPVPRRLR
ncbi:conserved hypothetical protein [Roseiflexus castenholzii DSM 13941]|uniref:Uncharacterized protein n=2 Tax=Roseiflexus castenholzii TaxID=120962 RepID=A7NJS2_ROSCS|nr:conserved hypothetical protein [Roseiflexus castenholzii DSM 13941]